MVFVIPMVAGILELSMELTRCPGVLMKLFFFTPFFSKRYGGFLKWWYPQIIHFNRVFHYKPSILGYPYFWKHPYQKSKTDTRCNLIGLPPEKDRFSSSGVSNRFFLILRSPGMMIPEKSHPKHFTGVKKQMTWEIKHLMLKCMVNFKDFPCCTGA